MFIPHDYHMHSNFSVDCQAPMEAMCRSAVEKGIPEIGFTEHYDVHPNEPNPAWLRFDDWWAEIERNRRTFEGQLIIRAGIEVGEPHLFREQTRQALARLPFDYVLGSLHWVGPQSVFSPEYFLAPMDAAFSAYFVELEHLSRAGDFDVLSHLDVASRVGYDVYGQYDPTRYEPLIRPVLQNCIDRGIALDINASALRRKAARLTPSVEILRWYREMGGERITLGSDAHRPEHLGAGLETALEVTRAAGLTHWTRFEGRRAQLVPLS